jgi:hypothetical protein
MQNPILLDEGNGDGTQHNISPTKILIPDKSFVVIEFPGYLKSTTTSSLREHGQSNEGGGNEEEKELEGLPKAIQMLGGMEKLSKQLQEKNKEGRLELKFRPTDPFSHGISCERIPSSNFLLKVTPSKNSSSSTPSPLFSAAIVGRIPVTYRFKTMADFQYLLPEDPQKRASIISPKLPEIPTSVDLEKGEGLQELFLLPPHFTKQDTPFAYG